MRRDQLEHAIRTACQIIEQPAVVVVGSQAILGTFTEDQLPPKATMSIEIDILPVANDNDETARLKLCAFREKDQNFVTALLDARLVDAEVIAKRLATTPRKHHPAAERALAWLAARQ
jgi:hypothetical protein